LRRILRDADKAEAGLTEGLAGVNIDQRKFLDFFNKNPRAIRLTENLVKERKPSEIKSLFRYDITNDLTIELARATTKNQVLQSLTKGFRYDGEDVFYHNNIGKYRVRRTPFAKAVTTSRYLTEVPKRNIIVKGDEKQLSESIKNMTNFLRTGSMPEEDIAKWLDGYTKPDGTKVRGAIEAMSENYGDPVDRANIWHAFNQLIVLTLRRNGVRGEVAEWLGRDAKKHVDAVKSYWMDAFGHEIDNGHMAMYMKMMEEDLAPDAYRTLLEGVGEAGTQIEFAQPMQIVEMLDRMQILPDPRELRRLTRNRLFTKIIDHIPYKDDEGFTKLRKVAITSRKRRLKVIEITDKPKHAELSKELENLTNLKGPARLAVNDRIDELEQKIKSDEPQGPGQTRR